MKHETSARCRASRSVKQSRAATGHLWCRSEQAAQLQRVTPVHIVVIRYHGGML